MASENVPSPVQAFRPTNTSEPTPAASRPGTSTTCIIVPPRPAASIRRKAPVSGDPSSVLMAAKLPAAATAAWVRAGASRLTSLTARTPSPPPRAISGALGAEYHAQAQRRERGQHDARKLAGAMAAPRRP